MNERDPLYFFNDAAFYKECLERNDLGHEALIRHQELLERTKPDQMTCFICENSLEDPDDFFSFGFLPSEEFYNVLKFRMCHESCLSNWEQLQEKYEELKLLRIDGEWDGRGPQRILETLEKAIDALK